MIAILYAVIAGLFSPLGQCLIFNQDDPSTYSQCDLIRDQFQGGLARSYIYPFVARSTFISVPLFALGSILGAVYGFIVRAWMRRNETADTVVPPSTSGPFTELSLPARYSKKSTFKVGAVIFAVASILTSFADFQNYTRDFRIMAFVENTLVFAAVAATVGGIIGILFAFIPAPFYRKFFYFFRVPKKYILKPGLFFLGIWVLLFTLYAVMFFFQPWFSGQSASEYFHDAGSGFTVGAVIFLLAGVIFGWLYGKIKNRKSVSSFEN